MNIFDCTKEGVWIIIGVYLLVVAIFLIEMIQPVFLVADQYFIDYSVATILFCSQSVFLVL